VYHYQISIRGNGGEFSLGSVPDKAGEYWKTQSKHDLLSHLNDPESCADDLVEMGVNLPLWHEIDDFAHEYGIEDVERITVSDLAGKSEVIADSAEPEWSARLERSELSISSKFESYNGFTLFSRSCEKGACIIDLSIEEPFDSSKFGMTEVELWDHTLIVGFSYAGQDLSFTETFDRSYADNDCLLKAPDGSLHFEVE